MNTRHLTATVATLLLTGCGIGNFPGTLPPSSHALKYGNISTIAGNGRLASTGDGGPATSAAIYQPIAIAFDSTGALYIADLAEEVIRKVAPGTGIISTYAGQVGFLGGGFSGNGGAASKASFYGPTGLVVDVGNNLYISDTANNQVREISAESGVVFAYAGNGTPNQSSTGTYAGDGGPATSAGLNHTWKLQFDKAGNLYFCDTGNSVIRKVDLATQTISTVAGALSGNSGRQFGGDGGLATKAQLNRPVGIAFDAAGNFYIADSATNTIRKVDINTGIIQTVAGAFRMGQPAVYAGDGGQATQANLNGPSDLTFDPDGNMIIADTSNNVIRRVNMTTGIIDTIAGTLQGYAGDGGPATAAKLNNPYAVTFDAAGNLYIADSVNGAIRKVSTSR